MDGGIGPHSFEDEAVLSSFSSVSAPELHIPDSPNISKESRVYAQPLPSPSDRIIATTTEPSLTTGDALDKYQIISQKVASHLVADRDDISALESSDPDPAGFHDQVSLIFAEWFRIYENPNDKISARFVLQLQQNGLLIADDTSDRFFSRLLEIAVSHCISSELINSSLVQAPQEAHDLSFLAIDMYASLIFSILKFLPVDHGLSKLSLLSEVLAVTVRFIQKDAEEKKASFNRRPYFRLFIDWVLDLSTLDLVFADENFEVLAALATTFHALQPLKVPAFSFVWLELVSHRSFMPKLLSRNAQKGWPYFQRLLVDLFLFMEPFLRNAELSEPVHFLYNGTLRVLLVLFHDFPEFLCDYHFSFCDIIPPSCIQMRNIVLSAFSRNMRLPDLSSPNLKIDLVAEISQSPRILSKVDAALKAKQMKSDVDEYLKTRPQGTSFLSELKQKLLLSPSEAARAGTRYNVPLMNSLVLYVGMQAIQQLPARTPDGQSMRSNASLAVLLVGRALDIFRTLILELETEGRYLFLNAVANQLRYPNNHTHYFSFILLYFFSELDQEAIQEHITRVLLERLIVKEPHPWGVLVTFIELLKNPRYNFWNRSFTRCAPEIEKLFESVSSSFVVGKPVDDNVALPDDLKTKLSIDDDLVLSPKEVLARATSRRSKYLIRRFDGRKPNSPAPVANQMLEAHVHVVDKAEMYTQKIPLKTIKDCTQDFVEKNVIGKGGYGKVYKGILTWADHVNEPVAVKRVHISGLQGNKEFHTEVTMLSQYQHANIITLIGFCGENKEMILVYEYATHGSLDTYLDDTGETSLSWLQLLEICIGVASALDYLHNHVAEKHRIIHRDIKSANVLLDENWNAKLSDFGLARIGLANQQNSFVITNIAGTYGYNDPQYERTGFLTKESDVYSFGVVLFEVLCGRLACDYGYHDERRFLHHLARTSYKNGKLEEIIDRRIRKDIKKGTLTKFSAIAYQCLQETRKERPTIAEVVFQLKEARKIQLER